MFTPLAGMKGGLTLVMICRRKYLLGCVLFFTALFCFFIYCARAGGGEVAVLLSREIRPYVSMVEGLELHLNAPVHRFFLDERGSPYTFSINAPDLTSPKFAVIVAVGPEAMVYLSGRYFAGKIMHAMVLNPRHVVPDLDCFSCGISLNIPAEQLIVDIKKQLPNIEKIGVLFDPKNNQWWFDRAFPLAQRHGLTLESVHISGLNKPLGLIGLGAVLFIPDSSISSKAVIQYIIKESFLRKVPVVGYNRFFNDNGAALSFVIDYRKVGEQAAAQVLNLLDESVCEDVSPHYDIQANTAILHALEPGDEGGRNE